MGNYLPEYRSLSFRLFPPAHLAPTHSHAACLLMPAWKNTLLWEKGEARKLLNAFIIPLIVASTPHLSPATTTISKALGASQWLPMVPFLRPHLPLSLLPTSTTIHVVSSDGDGVVEKLFVSSVANSAATAVTQPALIRGYYYYCTEILHWQVLRTKLAPGATHAYLCTNQNIMLRRKHFGAANTLASSFHQILSH